MKELHILVGMSGCGKTYWRKNFQKQHPGHGWFLKTDTVYVIKNIPTKISKDIHIHDYVVIDTSFSTVEEVQDCIRLFINNHVHFKRIIIHRWRDDINTCIQNNIARWNAPSENDMRNTSVPDFTLDDFTEFSNHNITIEIQRPKVRSKPTWMRLPINDEAEVVGDRYVYSEWYDITCEQVVYPIFDNYMKESVSFAVLDELFTRLNIYDVCKIYKIYDNVVKIETRNHERFVNEDRHGNAIYQNIKQARYVCDFVELTRYLRKNNLI